MTALWVLGALTFTALCLWLKKFPKLRAVAALFASLGIAYGVIGGLLTHLLTTGVGLVVSATDKLATITLGVAIPTIIAGALAFVLVHDLMPKHAAKMRTTVIAFILPLFAVAAGGAAGQLAANVHTGLVQASPAAVQSFTPPQSTGA